MFINKAELEKRKEEQHSLTTRLSVPPASDLPSDHPIAKLDTTKFKIDGTQRQVPLLDNDLRAIVAAATLVAGPKVGAEIAGVSEHYARALASKDYFSDPLMSVEARDRKNQELRDSIYQGLGKIRESAQEKLLQVLGLIQEETLEAIPDKDKAKLAASMANQLSSVIDRTINKGENIMDARSAHVHLYAPEQRPLATFEIKRVNVAPSPEADADANP